MSEEVGIKQSDGAVDEKKTMSQEKRKDGAGPCEVHTQCEVTIISIRDRRHMSPSQLLILVPCSSCFLLCRFLTLKIAELYSVCAATVKYWWRKVAHPGEVYCSRAEEDEKM
jgi:hypothetical protein